MFLSVVSACMHACKIRSVLSVGTLCDPVGHSPMVSSVHGIFQARILEWIAISSSRGTSWPRDQTWVSCMAARFFTNWVTRGRLQERQWTELTGCLTPVYNCFCNSALAWKITWTCGRLQSMGSQRVEHDWSTPLSPLSLKRKNNIRSLNLCSLSLTLDSVPSTYTILWFLEEGRPSAWGRSLLCLPSSTWGLKPPFYFLQTLSAYFIWLQWAEKAKIFGLHQKILTYIFTS